MNATTSSRGTPTHRHGRDWRPCPWLRPDPLTPGKAVSVWLYRWAAALQHLETLAEFVNAWPDEFPKLAGEA